MAGYNQGRQNTVPQQVIVGEIGGNFQIGNNYTYNNGRFNYGTRSDESDDSLVSDESQDSTQDDGRYHQTDNDGGRTNREETENEEQADHDGGRENRAENVNDGEELNPSPNETIENIYTDGSLRIADDIPENQDQIVPRENVVVAGGTEASVMPVIRDERIQVDGTIGPCRFGISFPNARSFIIAIPVIAVVGMLLRKWFKF